MSYVIYVDEMILWNTIINLAVINISSIILQEKIKLFRAFLFSFITALVTTFEYILTIRAEKYIHHIAYAGIYLIMIGIFFKILQPSVKIVAAIIGKAEFFAPLISTAPFKFSE